MLGDGYTAAERGKFERAARRLLDILFASSPVKEHKVDFNVWGLCAPALESGISRPSTGVHMASPLRATYDASGSERYSRTSQKPALPERAHFAPCRCLEIPPKSG